MSGTKRARSPSPTTSPLPKCRNLRSATEQPTEPFETPGSKTSTQAPSSDPSPPLSPTSPPPFRTNGLPQPRHNGEIRASLPSDSFPTNMTHHSFEPPDPMLPLDVHTPTDDDDGAQASLTQQQQASYGVRKVFVTVDEEDRTAMLQVENLNAQQAEFMAWAMRRMGRAGEMEMIVEAWSQWSGGEEEKAEMVVDEEK